MAEFIVKQTDVNIENKILCLMFSDENIIDMVITNGLKSDKFSFSLNQEIFDELIDIYTDVDCGNIAIVDDINILYDRLKVGDRERDKELLVHINKIKTCNPNKKHISLYINKLIELYKIRSIIQSSKNVIKYLKDNDNIKSEELIQIYEDSYQEIYTNVIDTTDSVDTKDAVKKTIEGIINDSTNETMVKFNLNGIDDYAKIDKGYLTYIVGDTGLGKTTLSANLVSACASNGLKILYINLETKTEDCIKKLISMNCELNGHKIKYTRLINPILLNDNDWDILEDIAINNKLSEMGIYWIHDTSMTVEELHRQIVRHTRMYDIDVVIGDYYQLLLKEGYEDSPESVVIPKVSKELMAMAGEHYIGSDGKTKLLSHIWLAQSTKEIIYRQNKRPQKEDIYFGGQRDARLVLGIYRDEYYNEETSKPNIFEIGILKQNNGIANEWFDYVFEPQYQTIRELTDEEKEILEENLDEDY